MNEEITSVVQNTNREDGTCGSIDEANVFTDSINGDENILEEVLMQGGEII